MARVELASIKKSFGNTDVVKGVSLTVEPGEFLVLVGPSGCGKSTCLRMIAGLEEVTAGEIRIGDRVVNDLAPKERDIGMVFQSYALYPHMNVRENMGFALTLQGTHKSKVAERVDEVAKSLGLTELLQRKPKELSGGQRQRVAIGRAIVKSPSVFLFDEPLSNLDAALRGQMRAELAELHQRFATTTVYVTHDQIEAMMLADRIAVLNAGVLQQIGAPLELFNRPANRFVASFIGSPAMNFLPARITLSKGVHTAACEVLKLPLVDFEASHLVEAERVVELGVRPQDVSLVSGSTEGAILGTVILVELLGWEAFVHVAVGDANVVARVEGARGATIAVGDAVSLQFRSEHIHIFDDSGESIWCGWQEASDSP